MRTSLLVASVALLASLSAPAADEPTAKQLKTSRNNIKNVLLATHAHNDVHNKLPGNIYSKDGKALLSWRVAILPYIEEGVLYEKFKLDEPWDSENNKKLIEKMPTIYAPVRVKAKEGETFYQTFTGKNTLFGDKGPVLMLANIPDGTSNTALVVEAGEPVIWSKPADLVFDEKKPLPKLGGQFDGEFYLGLCDGSVIRIKKDFDEAELKKVIMPGDGGVTEIKKLTK